MPIPFFAVGAAATAVATGVISLYRKRKSRPPNEPIELGSFAIWGRQNAGKTTFIKQILNQSIPSEKVGTMAKEAYEKIPEKQVDGKTFKINRITDMPGSKDRKDDWLKLFSTHDHVFYIINVAFRPDKKSKQIAAALSDLEDAAQEALKSENSRKSINIIASHIDKSEWASLERSEINNKLQEDPFFREILEELKRKGVAGYLYSADLTDKSSFDYLIESIIKDCHYD
ncbi:MAG: 50S ribosome-binding GTPase [Alcanivorax sp.]|nr:50S ribosome-binding GTPase [Alcanivorax sp.]